MTTLILKRASASRPSGEWKGDDYDVLADGVVAQCGGVTRRNAVDVDAGIRPPRGSHADARLRGNARGGDGGLRQKLTAGMMRLAGAMSAA